MRSDKQFYKKIKNPHQNSGLFLIDSLNFDIKKNSGATASNGYSHPKLIREANAFIGTCIVIGLVVGGLLAIKGCVEEDAENMKKMQEETWKKVK